MEANNGFNSPAASHIGAATMGSDQKHKGPVQSVTKSWPQYSSTEASIHAMEDQNAQIFFASRSSFWAMVAAHGLPSTCGPPEGLFDLGEEMGGAWRCVSYPFPSTDTLPPFPSPFQ